MVVFILGSLLLSVGAVISVRICPPKETLPRHCSCSNIYTTYGLELKCILLNLSELETISNSDYSQHIRRLFIVTRGIRFLPSSAFIGFKNLDRLIIDELQSDSIDNNTFNGLECTLSALSIRFTPLHEVPIAAIDRLLILHSFVMRNCQVNSLKASLRKMPLKELDFSNNRITTISDNILPPKLTLLNVDNNHLSSLNNVFGDSVPDLTSLSFANNNIFSLNGALHYVPKLIILDARMNQILTIDDGSLAENRDLRYLYLSHNRISKIENGLNGLDALINLDISHNNLSHVDTQIFWNLTKLQLLNLSHNSIDYIEDGLFDCLTSLKHLSIEFNNLNELKFFTPPNTGMEGANESSVTLKRCNFWNNADSVTISMIESGVSCSESVKKMIQYLLSANVTVHRDPSLCNDI